MFTEIVAFGRGVREANRIIEKHRIGHVIPELSSDLIAKLTVDPFAESSDASLMFKSGVLEHLWFLSGIHVSLNDDDSIFALWRIHRGGLDYFSEMVERGRLLTQAVRIVGTLENALMKRNKETLH